MLFVDRKDAGVRLAKMLESYKGENVVVFALPRGGVVLGVEIAESLNAPLDIVIAKKIGHPSNSEYAIGAVVEDGEPICNQAQIQQIDAAWLKRESEKIKDEIKRRRKQYLGTSEQRNIEGKTVLVVDDGIATGFTMIAAVQELRKRNPGKIVVATPVTPYDTAQVIKRLADELISPNIDKNYLGAVGAYYRDFTQVEDDEVIDMLERFR